MILYWFYSAVVITSCTSGLFISNEQRIHHRLFRERNYNKLARPEGDTPKGSLTVKLSFHLEAIMDVSEKNQILTSSLWLRHEWIDSRLRWDPRDTGGMNYTVIPSEMLWIPDIILYNNADGEFVISLMTKATVYHTGRIVWNPPAIYKSYCPIDVEFFPFDQQECFMKFGSWTNDIHTIDLRHFWEEDRGVSIGKSTFIPYGIDICAYQTSDEWDLINVTATRANKVYPCCQDDPYPYIMFNITIRRKTLFYTVNLILPIVAISTLSLLVFFLPANSRAKMTLSMSILVSLAVFFLLLSDINPPTSLVIPLIVKYLLLTMITVTLSIFLSVYILSIHCRSPSTHKMNPKIREIFIGTIPRYIFMKRPNAKKLNSSDQESEADMEMALIVSDTQKDVDDEATEPVILSEKLRRRTCVSKKSDGGERHRQQLIEQSTNGIKYIANRYANAEQDEKDELEWTFLAMVIDRLLLFIMSSAVLLGTCGIFLNAPTLYDPVGPLSRDIQGC